MFNSSADTSYPSADQHLSLALSLYASIFTQPISHSLHFCQASRLSMNIRAITVERGIATLTRQSPLPTLSSLSSRGDRNPDNAGAGGVGAVLSSPRIPAQQEEELEGGYYNDEEDEDGEIRQEDRSVINSTSVDDVERAIA